MTQKNPVPKVYLNHFFLIIDSATYKDITESNFIKNEFAPFEERITVVTDNRSYTGAYIYGENTYVELMDISKKPDVIPTDVTSGIAFGVDQKDEFKIIQKKLKEYKNAIFYLTTREKDGIQIPWFYSTSVFYGKEKSNIITWVMEYHQDFLKKWHPELAPAAPDIARKDILKRYTEKLIKPEQKNNTLFKDIIEVNLKLNQQDLDKLMGELAVFGYDMSRDGNETKCIGPDLKLVIETIDVGEGGITGFKMSLYHDRFKQATYRFGETSRLTLNNDKTATWIFY